MKLSLSIHSATLRQRGWALLAVMTLTAAGLMILAGVMSWANQNAAVISRNNEYFVTGYAAEAAAEKVVAYMSQDYMNYGNPLVLTRVSSYISSIPSAADGSYWGQYQFSGGNNPNQIIVTNTAASNAIVLGTPYTGLTMEASTYEIIASAKNTASMYGITTTVGEKINLGTIPLFQFAIFYQNDMEIAPGAAMTITGTVHGNSHIYLQPQNGLSFGGNVSSVQNIIQGESPLDPTSRTPGTITFNAAHLSDQNPLDLPVGTNVTGGVSNVAQNVSAILQLPQSGQTPTSATGQNLLYNQADLIVLVSNSSITVTSGANVNNQATVISSNQWQLFINTNGSFYDQRDSLAVDPVNINVSNLVTWSATNTVLRPVLQSLRGSGAADVQSIYVADMRSTSNTVIIPTVTTGVNYTTNSVTTVGYPLAGNYVPPVTTNTSSTTSSGRPGSGYLGAITTNTTSTTTGGAPANGSYLGAITTNTTSTTTSGAPGAGSYLGAVTTNTTYSNSSSAPAAGTYVGSYTFTSGRYYYYKITSYTYALISSYTYPLITGYTYAAITGYSYQGITSTPYTNTTYTTNYPIVSQPGVVLTNGSILPPQGLSIATPDPAYVVGNWNVAVNSGNSDAGLADTTYTRPSAVFADAISILSSAWNPANSALSISSRVANNDTVNAAFLTGNVPSNGSYYSGGVENFPRFLEDWGGKTFTYNGSMVAMFSSQIANAPWPGTGSVYNPPTRNWAFDLNFNNPAKQPPLTPQVKGVERSAWTMLAPGSTSF